MNKKGCFLIIGALLVSFGIYIENNRKSYKYDCIETCFTPEKRCTGFIINAIRAAKRRVYVQAYTWTSKEITEELVKMKQRGVEVVIILDKVNLQKNPAIEFLQSNNINLMIDYVTGIAHNKIMIIDDNVVITGSFNFSKAADTRNVENVLKISSRAVNARYSANWARRKKFAQKIDDVVINRNVYKPWKERHIAPRAARN